MHSICLVWVLDATCMEPTLLPEQSPTYATPVMMVCPSAEKVSAVGILGYSRPRLLKPLARSQTCSTQQTMRHGTWLMTA